MSFKKLLTCFAGLIVFVVGHSQPASAGAMDTYGINDHLDRYSDYNAACDEIIASGVKWVRVGPEWRSIQPNAPTSTDPGYDTAFLGKLDAIVNKLSAGGVNIDFVLCYTAPWASSMPSDPKAWAYKPANWTDWGDYVHFVTSRYAGKIHSWEVWNEEDSTTFWKSSATDYVTLLQTAATQIRLTDATNQILLGGLTGGGVAPGGFFDQILAAGAAGGFDIVNYHSYLDSAHWISVYRLLAQTTGKYGLTNRKIWITESGYSSLGDAAKEVIKADMVDQVYLLPGTLPNVERVFWYVHRNITPTGDPSEDNFGLIANDRTPLQAFYYYQAAGGAETDFKLHKAYPTQTTSRRTLYYNTASPGVVDEAPDGSTKRIPSGQAMYLWIKDSWLHNANGGLDSRTYVDVTYLNSGTGTWSMDYDGQSNIYTSLGQTKTNTGAWVTKTFTLDDGKFANRQTNGCDLRISAGSADLVVSKVAIRKDMGKARLLLATTDRYRLATRPDSTVTTDEAYNPVASVGGRECRKIVDNTHYIYAQICDALLRSSNPNVKISITFWDFGTDSLTVFYDGIGGTKSYSIAKTNTNTWRTVTTSLTDAAFNDLQHYFADFRISNAGDGSLEYISQIDVEKGP
jgi:hypothetical protein